MTQTSAYWDEVVAEVRAQTDIETWRAYMRGVYGRLIENWLQPSASEMYLKTDLFEEAVSVHSPLADLGPGAVGLDGSQEAVRAAHANLAHRAGPLRLLVGDLRALPLAAGSVAGILSGSSLDHFSEPADLRLGLSELRRCLGPGGVLVITLDNPQNPVVWLRNRLPFGLLHQLGLVPYFVGVTFTQAQARSALEHLGFRVTHTTAVVHAPRAPAIWLSALLARLGQRGASLAAQRMLHRFEILERYPTRYLTGYYIALRAEVPAP